MSEELLILSKITVDSFFIKVTITSGVGVGGGVAI